MKKLLTLALAVLMCVFAISAMADTVSIDRTLELQFVPSKDADVIITGTKNLPELLKAALLEQGYDVKVSEVHGMSQRGGSVVTYVRYGDRVNSPVIDKGEADYIVSFELLEAARWLSYLKPDGQIVTSTQQIDPMPVITGAAQYPENLVEKMKAAGAKVDALDCLALAEEAGSSKAVNIVLMGRLSHYFDLPDEAWQKSLEVCVPSKFLELNKKAFQLGKNA